MTEKNKQAGMPTNETERAWMLLKEKGWTENDKIPVSTVAYLMAAFNPAPPPKSEAEVEEEIDKFLIERGEHPSRVRNPIYSEERKLAKDLLSRLLSAPSKGKYTEKDMRNSFNAGMAFERTELIWAGFYEWLKDYNNKKAPESSNPETKK